MKISIITPSVRTEMLRIVEKSLMRQTFKDFEWIIARGNPISPLGEIISPHKVLYDPPKKDGEYYSLNKGYNQAFKKAQGELIVSIQDGIWFPPDTLEKLWSHYEANPKSVIGAVGNQYDQLINGKPEHMVWQDSRIRTDQGSFYETLPTEIEWSLASFPKQAIFDVGGVPEDYDKGAALSEKITNLRFEKAGYKLYLDQSIEYRAVQHPRAKGWDEAYKITTIMYSQDAKDVIEGRNLKLDYLS